MESTTPAPCRCTTKSLGEVPSDPAHLISMGAAQFRAHSQCSTTISGSSSPNTLRDKAIALVISKKGISSPQKGSLTGATRSTRKAGTTEPKCSLHVRDPFHEHIFRLVVVQRRTFFPFPH